MNRRGFLAAILATATAPAIVKASSLMPVRLVDHGGILTIDHIAELKRWCDGWSQGIVAASAPAQKEMNVLAAQYLSVIVDGCEYHLPLYD